MAANKKEQPSGKRIGKGTSRKKKKQPHSLKERLFKAMTHPLRYQILTKLNDREWSPNELSEELAEGLSQVSYHVKVLKNFKLIEMTKTRPARGAVEHFYRAIQRPIIDMEMAKDMPKSGRAIVIGEVLGEINEDVNESVETGAFDSRDDYHCTRIPVRLDDRGCKDAHALGDEYIEAMLEIGDESAERLLESDDPEALGVTAILLIFPSPRSTREKESPKKKTSGKRKKRK